MVGHAAAVSNKLPIERGFAFVRFTFNEMGEADIRSGRGEMMRESKSRRPEICHQYIELVLNTRIVRFVTPTRFL